MPGKAAVLVPVIAHIGIAAIAFYHGTQPYRRWDKYTFPIIGVVALGIAGLFLVPFWQPIILPLFWFVAKAGLLLFIFIWVRGTLPRFRYDQLMHFAWTCLFPVAMVNLLVTALAVGLF